MLRLIATLVVFLLWPVASAAAPDCYLGNGTTTPAVDWCTGDDITVLSSTNCDGEDFPPAGTHNVGVAAGVTVSVVGNCAYTTDGSSLEIEADGTFQAYAFDDDVEGPIVLTMKDGQDGLTSANAVAYDAVSFWGKPDSNVDLRGGYTTRFLATADVLENYGEMYLTEWRVAGHSLCTDTGSANEAAGSIGGDQTCATGSQEYGFSLVYTEAENNPRVGEAEDNYLDESITKLSTYGYTCVMSGMDAGLCYQNETIDSTASVFNIRLDTRHLAAGYTADTPGYPLAERINYRMDSVNAVPKGSTCVESAASEIAADGELVDYCMYCYDGSSANGWSTPRRITRTQNSMTCAQASGGTGDAFHFAKEAGTPAALVAGADCVLSPICIGRGDRLAQLNPILILTLPGAHADGDGKFLMDGANVTMHGVVLVGSSRVIFDEANTGPGGLYMVHSLAGGRAGVSHFFFDYMADPRMTASSAIGGSIVSGNNDGIHIGHSTGNIVFERFTVKYLGGIGILGSSASETLTILNSSCEKIGLAGASVADGCINNQYDYFDSLFVDGLFVGDHAEGPAGAVVNTGDNPAVLSSIGISGQRDGILTNDGSLAKVNDLIARGVYTDGKTYAGDFLSFADIDDFQIGVTTDGTLLHDGASGMVQSVVSNGVTLADSFIDVTESTSEGFLLSENIFANIDTPNTTCTAAAGELCRLIDVTFDASAATAVVIQDNTVMYSTGETTLFDSVFYSNDVANETGFVFSGNLVDNFNTVAASAEGIPIDWGAQLATASLQNGKNNCVSSASSPGTLTYVADIANYSTTPILGVAPEYAGNSYVLRSDSTYDRQLCGAPTGAQAPGSRSGNAYIRMKMGLPEKEYPVIDRD